MSAEEHIAKVQARIDAVVRHLGGEVGHRAEFTVYDDSGQELVEIDGRWHHVAVLGDGRAYVDAVAISLNIPPEPKDSHRE